MIWAAAWVDSREQLQKAYRRVLKVKNAHRREMLLAELADLPINLSDVQGIPARMKSEAQGNSQEWRARERLKWADRFRQHYRNIFDHASEKKKKAN